MCIRDSTEAMIKTEVQSNKTHEIATLKYLDAKKQADLLLALKEAFVSRGFMIRDLCGLYNANYFEEASVRGTGETNRATYSKGRQRIAEARERR